MRTMSLQALTRPMMMRDAAIEGSIDEMVKRTVFVYILELTNSPQL